jgi:hypothetical protein
MAPRRQASVHALAAADPLARLSKRDLCRSVTYTRISSCRDSRLIRTRDITRTTAALRERRRRDDGYSSIEARSRSNIVVCDVRSERGVPTTADSRTTASRTGGGRVDGLGGREDLGGATHAKTMAHDSKVQLAVTELGNRKAIRRVRNDGILTMAAGYFGPG